MAAQLLGVDSVRLWQDQALYKEAGGRETTAHQDETFWPIGKAPLVSAWIPFDAVTPKNGAMAYVPGSHRAGSLKQSTSPTSRSPTIFCKTLNWGRAAAVDGRRPGLHCLARRLHRTSSICQ